MLAKTEWYVFLLAAFTVSLVYYVGLKSDAQAVQAAFSGTMNTLMGRDSGGKFQVATQQ